MEFTDETAMPWGKYQGQKLANVPGSYLLWLYNENKAHGQLKVYIIDNMQVIRMQAANKRF